MMEPRGEKGEYTEELLKNVDAIKYFEAVEGSRLLLFFEVPKDREPVRLKFIYPFTESWEKVSIKEGQIEIDLQVTPTPTVTPSPIPTPTHSPVAAPISSPTPAPIVILTPTPVLTPSPTATVAEIPTPEEKGISGFEVIFAITGLLAVAYLLRRR